MKDTQLNDIDDLVHLVLLESQSQVDTWGVQEHSMETWMLFLTEEVGELAAAMGECRFRYGALIDVTTEAIQVATLALKIASMTRRPREELGHENCPLSHEVSE